MSILISGFSRSRAALAAMGKPPALAGGVLTNHYSNNSALIECISKDINSLLNFFFIKDYEPYRIYTTNTIESLFSPLKSRSRGAKGNHNRNTLARMTFAKIRHLAPLYGVKKNNDKN
jgi:hypothetical protein